MPRSSMAFGPKVEDVGFFRRQRHIAEVKGLDKKIVLGNIEARNGRSYRQL